MSKKGWKYGEQDAKATQKFMEASAKELTKTGSLEDAASWPKKGIGFFGRSDVSCFQGTKGI